VTTTAPAPVEAPVPPSRPTVRSRGRFLLVCGILVAAVGLLLYKGLLSSLDYFDTVDQALAHRAQIGTGTLRLEGLVDSARSGRHGRARSSRSRAPTGGASTS